MKRYYSLFCIILLGIVSCVKETPFESDKRDLDEVEIRISGVIDQMATKADDKGFYDGDAFGVYITDGTTSIADNERFVYDAASGSWISGHTIYFTDSEKNVSIVGYYPYKDNLENPGAYSFEVAKDQQKPAGNGMVGGYEASDFLYASKKDVKPTANVITLLFKHKFANMKVTLLKGAGWADDEWAQVSKDVLVTNTVRQSVVNLSTGSVQTDGTDRSMGIVPLDMGGNVWRAVVVPQEVPADLPIVSITIDGQAREYMYGSAYRYYDGKQNSLTLAVNKTAGYQGFDLELISEGITAWEDDANVRDESSRDYLVVNCPEGGKLKETILAEGYQLESIKSLKVEGTINSDDFYFMRDELPILQAVNLMDVTTDNCFIEYNGQDDDGFSIRVTSANSIPYCAFQNKKTLMKVVFPSKLQMIGEYAFKETSIKGDIVFPEGLTYLGYGSFMNIKTVNGTVSFPSTLRIIRGSAFENSTIRGEVAFPEGIVELEGGIFNSTDISHILLPSSLRFLGGFGNCHNFKGTIEIPKGVEEIGRGCFYNTPLQGGLVLHEGLKSIVDYAFTNCHLTGPLIIPSTVTTIGDWAFNNNAFSSIALPSSLTNIGNYSFYDASNDAGYDLIVPEGLTSIPQWCFVSNSINNLHISGSVEYIDRMAFAYCHNTCSIICDAAEPPILGEDAFAGVAKDNFALEVPESSVVLYQNAPGWSEFKRIVAHRDFSISRRLFRLLNNAETRTFTLRAESGASWTVESKPDWVTASPMSGTGKTEVSVSVSALAKGSGYREGEIVYKLTGSDFYASTTVEQYDYQYADGDVYTVQTHSKGRGIHIVFMGDCYDAKDISEGKYLENTQEAIEHFFAIEPYNTYKDYFDVHIVFGCSEDSGIGDVNTIRSAKFGSQYSLTEGVMFDDAACLTYAAKVNRFAPSIAGICLILNSDLEDGVTCLYDNDLFISLCPMGKGQYPNDFRGIVQHEAGGHGFGKLGDEAIYHPTFIQSCTCLCCPHVSEFLMGKAHGWYDNLSLTGDMYKVPWSHLLFDSKYSDLVDIFEGGFYHARGVYRSEANSCMRNRIPYYSTISRESIVKRIMKYAGVKYSFETFKADDVIGAYVNTKSSFEWDVPLYDTAHHREPVLVGESPEINTNR